MATFKGKKVTLNKPRYIAKGETSHGKKKSVVYVKDGDRVKRVTFGDPNMNHHQLEGKALEQGIIVLLQKIKLQQNIGLVRHGKWQKLK